MYTLIKRISFVAFLCATLLITAEAVACSVPVFRYALERWPAGTFRLTVYHSGELDEATQAAIDFAKAEAFDESVGATCNLFVETVDVSGKMDEFTRLMWEEEGSPELPWSVLRYPPDDIMSRVGRVAWRGRITQEIVQSLIDSPARQKIVKRIKDKEGDDAVWIYLTNDADDEAAQAKSAEAVKELKATLKKLEEELSLPEIDPYDAQWNVDPYGTPAEDLKENLKIKFSVIHIDRSDEKEAMLIQLLLNTDPSLAKEPADKPLAFAVFGRGRALPPLIGDEINAENVGGDCQFLVGPCSCIVKEENPGTDLLFATNWEDMMGDLYIKEMPLPPLPDMSKPIPDDAVIEGHTPTQPHDPNDGTITLPDDPSKKSDSSE